MAASKTVVVTGSGGGLGRCIGEAFLREGANVVFCDINQTRLDAVTAELSAAYEGRFLAHHVDITDDSAVSGLFDASITQFGAVDVLVNNAGILDDFSPVGDLSKDMWHRVFNVNVTAAFYTSRAAVKAMMTQKGGGTIINISSTAGIEGFMAGAAYTASKHAIVGLSKNTAAYYGPHSIYSITLLVGGMAGTNITDAFATGMHHDLFQKSKANVPGNPGAATPVPVEGVAQYCVFLSRPDIAPTANGSCIRFDGNFPQA